jgi:hypothetical protein
MAQLLTGTRIYGTGTVDTQLFVSGANTASSTTTGALQVVGGVGIGGALYASSINAVSSYPGTTASVALSISNIYGNSTGTWILPYAAGGNFNPTTQEGDSAFIFHGQNIGLLSALNIAPWSTTATGIRITNLGIVTVASTVASTGTASGALVVKGGVGIGGALWIGTTSYIAGSTILTDANFNNFGVGKIIAGTDTVINTSTGAVTIWNNSTLQSVTSRGSSTNQAMTITNTSSSTGTATGALVVYGGVGIGGNVYIGKTSYIDGSQIITSATISTFQSLKGQYIPRTAYIDTNSLVVIVPSLYDSYVVTARGGTIVFQINSTGYTPFDGQKLLIRIYEFAPSNLSWTYGSTQFRTVGISPPQITGGGTIYVGVMFNQTFNQWDILSAVIQ